MEVVNCLINLAKCLHKKMINSSSFFDFEGCCARSRVHVVMHGSVN